MTAKFVAASVTQLELIIELKGVEDKILLNSKLQILIEVISKKKTKEEKVNS